MKRIYVCSPYSGDIETNTANARLYMAYVLEMGHAPFVPHLLYTQVLNDSDPKERKAGINAGIAYLKTCDEMWVFPPQNNQPTAGMRQEIMEFDDPARPIKIFHWGFFRWQE